MLIDSIKKVVVCSVILLLNIAFCAKAQEGNLVVISREAASITQSDSLVASYLLKSGIPITPNNQIRLLKSGQEKFEDLFETIAKAKHHVHLEYFNFRNDSIANVLFELLALKAKEGVQVRAIFDDFGNWSNSRPLKRKHIEAIRKRRIEIVHFDPLRFPYVNHALHRDHRKIAIIDGEVAYTGGINIADYYIKGLPEIGAWRDMHMRIEGGAVKYLQKIFLTMWEKTTGQRLTDSIYFPIPVDTLGEQVKSVAIVDRDPKSSPKQIRLVYAESIRRAEHLIQIVNPYFLPTSSIKKALDDAIKRGVRVEIMISSKADIAFTPQGSIHVAHHFMKLGAQVYLYNGGFHHSKIMMIDDQFCTIGTANLNSRSLCYDYEVNAFVFDKEITNQLSEIFNADIKDCTLLTPQFWKERSAWKKFVGWTAKLCTPFL